MWHRSILDCVRQAKKEGLCLYGAGFWGNVAYEIFQKFHVVPVCYCDDDCSRWGESYNGVPVVSLEEAALKYPYAVYIVCIDETQKEGNWGRKQQKKMLERLKKKGIYSRHSECRIIYYLFLLDLDETVEELVKPGIEEYRQDVIREDDICNLVMFNHMSNSGSYYLEQLLDGHSHILCLPYSQSYLERVYEVRLCHLEGVELLVEMAAQMLGYFHSKYEGLWCVGRHKFQGFCVDKHGNFMKEVLICPKDFMRQLRQQFGNSIKLRSHGHMLKIFFAAYNNCLGKKRQEGVEYWAFYHMHMPNFDAAMYGDTDAGEFKRVENLMIIREPVQHCYSWVRRIIKDLKMDVAVKNMLEDVLKSELGMMLEKKEGVENVRAIRFEDLKYHTKETMGSLCRWLKIPFEKSILETTLNGRVVYFPVHTPEGVRYITGNDTSAVAQKDYSEILTLWDETRLNMIYAGFKKAYGYENPVPAFSSFSQDFLKEMLQEDFKFAAVIEGLMDECTEEPDHETSACKASQLIRNVFMDYMFGEPQKDRVYYDYIKPDLRSVCIEG